MSARAQWCLTIDSDTQLLVMAMKRNDKYNQKKITCVMKARSFQLESCYSRGQVITIVSITTITEKQELRE